MTERTLLAIKLIVSHIVLILGLTVCSIFVQNDAFLLLTITQTVLSIIFFAGYWEFFGIRFRYVFCAIIQLFLLAIFTFKMQPDIYYNSNVYVVISLSLVQLLLLYKLSGIFLVIYKKDNPSFEINFPFNQGEYLITDGGNSKTSRLMNYHYYSPVHKRNKTNNSMLFAADIVKVDKAYPSFLPDENGQYPVFGMNIYSPMDGVVVKVEDNIQDNKPYSENYPYNTGNTVVIKKDNYFLLLGHLNFDSIIVRVGDHIKTNELIGRAGNSGWTERPHLHMQLIKSETDNYWMGIGVSIRYKNRKVYKNRYLKV